MAGLALWGVEADTRTSMAGHRAQAGSTRDIDKVSGRRLLPPEDTLRSPTGVVRLILFKFDGFSHPHPFTLPLISKISGNAEFFLILIVNPLFPPPPPSF